MTPSFNGRMAVTEPGGAAQHALGFVSHGQNLVPLDGDDRRLAQNDALVLDVDQGVGGARSMPCHRRKV